MNAIAPPRILAFAESDVGLVRTENQDRFLIEPEAHLYAVADGMGGHRGGAVAASLAISALADAAKEDMSEARGCDWLMHAVTKANGLVHQTARSDPDLSRMGTTLTGVLFLESSACIAHVGDSRLYRIRDNEIVQLTLDHTIAQEQLRAGIIGPEQLARHPFRHHLTRSVGIDQRVDVDLSTTDVREGDFFVLSSDGLTNHLSPEEIMKGVLDTFIHHAPSRLTRVALGRGGEDNVTVLVLYVNGLEEGLKS